MATIDRRGASLSSTDPATATDPNPDLAIKTPVDAATTANITLAGVQTVDGVSVGNNAERVLVKNQTDATTNGIYVAQSGNWTRAVDMANNSQVADGMIVDVTGGTANAGNIYRLAATDPVVLGTSTLVFNQLAISVAPFTGDSGSGGAQGLVPAPTAGQGAANAVLKASGGFGIVGLTNVRLAKTGPYTLANADKGKTIALGGSAFFALTVGSASGYDADYAVILLNEDAGRGKQLSISGLSSFILWPLQSVVLFNQNGTWQVLGRSRWLQTGIIIHVDPLNGSDTNNDGLATGTGGAMQTIPGAWRLATQNFDPLGGSIEILLADGTHSSGLPFTMVGGQAGSFLFSITGAAGHGANVIIGGQISVKDFLAVGFVEVTFSAIVGSAIECDQNGIVDIDPTVTFGNGGDAASFVPFVAANGGVVNVAGCTVNCGKISAIFQVQFAGRINSEGTINIPTAMTVGNATAFADSNGVIDAAGTVFSGAGVAGTTGQRYLAQRGGGIWTNGGGASFFPGSSGGTATSPGWYG